MAVTLLLGALLLFIGLLAWKGRGTLHEGLHREWYDSPEFPEDHFPPKDAGDFRGKTARGYEKMKRGSLIICGITRDDAETLPLTIRRIERTGRCFRDYRVVIFENDSADETPGILHQWEAENARVTVLSESIRDLPLFSRGRFERLAYCRNRYLDHIRQARAFDSFDTVMVVDMDLRGGWSLDGIASSFAAADEWDAVASNSIGYHYLRKTYYDTWALEPKTVLKRRWFYRLCGEGWQFRRNDPLVPVQSGFGGLGIYRREAILARRYEGSRDGAPVCEHDALNADRRLRFFMNPSQITVTGTQESKGNGAMPPWKRTLSRIFLNW